MRRHASPPICIPGLDVVKAKRYTRTRIALFAMSTLWTLARLAWFATDRRASRLKGKFEHRLPDQRIAAPAFLATTTWLSWLTSLPLSFVGGFIVDRQFGLTKQSATSWLTDQLKSMILGTIFQTTMLTVVYAVMRRRPRDWWLIVASGSVPVAVGLSHVAPILLMPLFNRFVPLQDEEVARRVRTLAERSGVAVSDVYEMNMSRQSEKPNAMFTGLGRTKRIVLGDTLLERFSPDEVEAVVAHELGHQVRGDIWRLISFGTVTGFMAAWAMARLAPPLVRLTRDKTGVSDLGDEASLPVLALIAGAVGGVMMPLQAAFSRAIERQADQFAVELTGNGEIYAQAMERLAAQSLADPDPPRPIVFMFYSHPPVAQRIRAARDARKGPHEGNAAATDAAPEG